MAKLDINLLTRPSNDGDPGEKRYEAYSKMVAEYALALARIYCLDCHGDQSPKLIERQASDFLSNASMLIKGQ